MICGICRKRMKSGILKVNFHGRGYPVIQWYENKQLVCELNNVQPTMGFFCPDCGVVTGVFFNSHQVGFTSEYNHDLDDKIDSLPSKTCPECGAEIDIDYPNCPECGYVFF